MYSDDFARIKFLIEDIHRFAQAIRTAMNLQLRMISGCTAPLDIIGEHDLNA